MARGSASRVMMIRPTVSATDERDVFGLLPIAVAGLAQLERCPPGGRVEWTETRRRPPGFPWRLAGRAVRPGRRKCRKNKALRLRGRARRFPAARRQHQAISGNNRGQRCRHRRNLRPDAGAEIAGAGGSDRRLPIADLVFRAAWRRFSSHHAAPFFEQTATRFGAEVSSRRSNRAAPCRFRAVTRMVRARCGSARRASRPSRLRTKPRVQRNRPRSHPLRRQTGASPPKHRRDRHLNQHGPVRPLVTGRRAEGKNGSAASKLRRRCA
jgi:hypothetical protein